MLFGIVFGTYFGGKVKELDKQWVETKYLLLMIPLIPTTTMFVTGSKHGERSGFIIDAMGKSIIHGYLRFLTFIPGVIMLLVSLVDKESDISFNQIPIFYWGIICALVWCYSYFNERKEKGADLMIRKKLGAIIQLNALPHWLPNDLRNNLLHNLNSQLVAVFGNADFNELLNRPNKQIHEIALLYTALSYMKADNDTFRFDTALHRIDQQYDNHIQQYGADKTFFEVRKKMMDSLVDDATTVTED